MADFTSRSPRLPDTALKRMVTGFIMQPSKKTVAPDRAWTRFNMEVTMIMFVDVKERNTVNTAYELYRSQADYAVARGGMRWVKGALSKPVPDVPAKYEVPITSAGSPRHKKPGRAKPPSRAYLSFKTIQFPLDGTITRHLEAR